LVSTVSPAGVDTKTFRHGRVKITIFDQIFVDRGKKTSQINKRMSVQYYNTIFIPIESEHLLTVAPNALKCKAIIHKYMYLVVQG
jgi:hypothetical protein